MLRFLSITERFDAMASNGFGGAVRYIQELVPRVGEEYAEVAYEAN